MSLFDDFFGIMICVVYYMSTLSEIAYHLRIPVLGVVSNVYCNGVFDLLHEGHVNLFEFASKQGNRVIVGVHSDAAVESYKRTPTMTHDERYRAALKSDCVDQVVPNAPLVVTEEFIKKHNITTIICSVEYDSPDDKYYADPRRMGILVVKPRTNGISTSELRRRIKNE